MVSATEHLWMRYLPGLAAAMGSVLLVGSASSRRRTLCAGAATLWGLVCMEAEYWVAHGFPKSEAPFFTVAVAVSLAALAFGSRGGMILSIIGMVLFAYVNLRYGAPYLLDYLMPVLYAALLASSRRDLNWVRPGILNVGRLEIIWLVLVEVLAVCRTTALGKWGWLAGRPW